MRPNLPLPPFCPSVRPNNTHKIKRPLLVSLELQSDRREPDVAQLLFTPPPPPAPSGSSIDFKCLTRIRLDSCRPDVARAA